MSISHPYIIEGATGSFNSDINGYRFTVHIILDDVFGSNDVEQMYYALTDPSVPLIGSDLSAVDSDLAGCWLRDITCAALGDRQFRLSLHYQQSPFNEVQISTNTQTSHVESNRGLPDEDNPAGKPVNTQYDYPSTGDFIYGGELPTERQQELRGTTSQIEGGTFPKLVPESTRVYTVREAEDGDVIARGYVGTINDAVWQDGEAGTWMLTNVTGLTDNSQQSPLEWVNSYTFQYQKDGWKPEVVHVDAETNQPVPNPFGVGDEYVGEMPSVSRVLVDAYEETDFTDLFPAVDP